MLVITAALLGGIIFFKETLYMLPLTMFLIMIMIVYALFNSRRKNSINNSSGKPEQENKASPDKDVEQQE